MKIVVKFLVLLGLIGALAGCGLAAKELRLKSQSEKTDVFNEVREAGIPERGFADLIITTSIKTHLEGYYFIDPDKTFHGREGYPLLINIDGQAVTWKLKGQREIISQEKGNPNAEEGEGMRYTLNRRIRLASGQHKIFFGLPGEKIYKKIDLIFSGGSINVLEFKPSYRSIRGRSTRSFLRGVDGGELFFNGNPITTGQP